MLEGRGYVLPDDVKYMAECVLSHRIVMKNRSGAEGTTAVDVVNTVLSTVKVPKIKG